MRTAAPVAIVVLGIVLTLGALVFSAVRVSLQPPKPIATTYTTNFAIEPPAKAATLDHDTGELQYRTEVNQSTIDALMDVEGVTNVSQISGWVITSGTWYETYTSTAGTPCVTRTYEKVYELKISKAKAFTWQEIDALLVDAGLLEAKR